MPPENLTCSSGSPPGPVQARVPEHPVEQENGYSFSNTGYDGGYESRIRGRFVSQGTVELVAHVLNVPNADNSGSCEGQIQYTTALSKG